MCKDSFFYRKVAGFRIKSYICKDEKYLNDCIMETCHWILAGWLVFDLYGRGGMIYIIPMI